MRTLIILQAEDACCPDFHGARKQYTGRQRQTNTRVPSRRQHSPRELRFPNTETPRQQGRGVTSCLPASGEGQLRLASAVAGGAGGRDAPRQPPTPQKRAVSFPAPSLGRLPRRRRSARFREPQHLPGWLSPRAGGEDGTAFSRVPLPPAPVARGPRWRRGAGRVRARRARRLREGLRRAPSRGTGPWLQGGTARGGLGTNHGVLGSW